MSGSDWSQSTRPCTNSMMKNARPITASSSHNRCMRGTGTPLPCSALITLYSRSIACADGSSLVAGPGLERIT